MTDKITVYTKPACVACNATKRRLNGFGVVFDAIDITKSEADREAALSLGYLGAPVVVVSDGEHLREDTHWYGYRPDLIDSVVGDRLTAFETKENI